MRSSYHSFIEVNSKVSGKVSNDVGGKLSLRNHSASEHERFSELSAKSSEDNPTSSAKNNSGKTVGLNLRDSSATKDPHIIGSCNEQNEALSSVDICISIPCESMEEQSETDTGFKRILNSICDCRKVRFHVSFTD